MSIKQRIEDNFALSVAAFGVAAFVAGWTANERMYSAAREEVEARSRLVETRSKEFPKEIEQLESQLEERKKVLGELLSDPASFTEANGIVVTAIKVRVVGKDGNEKTLNSKIYVGDSVVVSLGYKIPPDKRTRISLHVFDDVVYSYDPSSFYKGSGYLSRRVTFGEKGPINDLMIQFNPEEGEPSAFKLPLNIEVF